MTLLLTLAFVLIHSVANATTYYIDITTGLDTRTSAQAQSKTTPWAHAPGMASATSNAAAYTPVAGDNFVFKGGETWGNANFPLTVNVSGNSSNSISYGGLDVTWFTGGSWSLPIFDAASTVISGTYNHFIDLRSRQYVTIKNIEMIRFKFSAGGYSFCQQIDAYQGTNLTLDGLHIHNFGTGAGTDCYVILADTTTPWANGSVIRNSHIHDDDGGEISYTGPKTGGGSVSQCWPGWENNVIHNMQDMIKPCGHGTISGNLLYNCFFQSGSTLQHGNVIEALVAGDGAYYIHDNVIHDTETSGGGTNECEAMFLGNPGETDYVWNNVIYNLSGNAPGLVQDAIEGDAAYFWNNTIVPVAGGNCFRQRGGTNYPILEFKNNHCISTAASMFEATISATSLTQTTNLLQTPAAAAAQGYNSSQTYVYSPTDAGDATVGTGTALTANCTGSNAGLCSDTTYGSVLTNDLVSGAGRTAGSRGATWDIGAYMQSASGGGPGTPSPTFLFISSMAGVVHLAGLGIGMWSARHVLMDAYAKCCDQVFYWQYRFAVRRWQKQAPIMLPEPITIIEMHQFQPQEFKAIQ